MLIVVGYASQEVQEQLARVTDHYLVYAPGELAALDQLLASVKMLVANPPQPRSDPEQSNKLEQALADVAELRARLEQLLDTRQQESQLRDQELQGFVQYQREAEQQRLADQAARLRLELQQREQDRLERASAEKERREWEERERLRVQGEEDRERLKRTRRQQLVVPYALSIIVGLAVAVAVLSSSLLRDSSQTTVLTTTSIIIGMLFLSAMALLFWTRDTDGEDDLVRSARASVPNVTTLDRIGARLSRENRIDLLPLLSDPNPQVQYVAARALSARPEIASQKRRSVEDCLFKAAWLPLEAALIALLAGVASREDSAAAVLNSTQSWAEYLAQAGDPEALYVVDALVGMGMPNQIERYLPGRDFPPDQLSSLVSRVADSLLRRPTYVLAACLLAGVLPKGYSPVRLGAGRVREDDLFVLELAATVAAGEATSQSNGARLGARFLAREQTPEDAAALIQAPEFSALQPETLQHAAEIFGIGGPDSLGYYYGLRDSTMYQQIYRFLFRLRLALEEQQYQRRR